MEYVCHVYKIELEIESVPTCQEQYCERDIQLTYMSCAAFGRRCGTESRTSSECGS